MAVLTSVLLQSQRQPPFHTYWDPGPRHLSTMPVHHHNLSHFPIPPSSLSYPTYSCSEGPLLSYPAKPPLGTVLLHIFPLPVPVPFRSQLKDHLLRGVFLDYSAKPSPRPSSFPVDSSCPVRVSTQRPPPQKGLPSPACKATSRPGPPRRQPTLPAPSPGLHRHAGRGTLTSRNCTRPFSPSALRHSYAVPDCRKSCARHMLSLRNREPMAAPPRSAAAARAPAPWGSAPLPPLPPLSRRHRYPPRPAHRGSRFRFRPGEPPIAR